jgi:hypothetical protein
VEWLGYESLGADFLRPAASVTSRGHDQHRYCDPLFFQDARELPTVNHGHTHVQQDQRGLHALDDGEPFGSIGGFLYLVALEFEDIGDRR